MRNLSRIIALLIAVLSFTFTSCDKSDDPQPTQPSQPVNNTPGGNNGGTNNPVTGNTTPVVVNDVATTDRETDVTIDVISNDSDADMDALSVVDFEMPDNGSVMNNFDGTLTFSPDGSFVGTVTFEYTVTDGTDETTGTVTVTVTKTAAETATENLIAANTETRIGTVDGMQIFAQNKRITFDTNAKTVSVNFTQDATINFTMSANNTESYTISSNGQLVLGGVTYNVTERSPSGLTFEAVTSPRVNTTFDTLNENI